MNQMINQMNMMNMNPMMDQTNAMGMNPMTNQMNMMNMNPMMDQTNAMGMNQMTNQMNIMDMNPMMDQTNAMGMNPMTNQMNIMDMNPMMNQMNMNPKINQMNIMDMNPMMEQINMMHESIMNQIMVMNNMVNNNYNSKSLVYYNIKHKNPLNDNKLSKIEKNLCLFFNGITNFNKNYHNNGNKIIINYYNLEKIDLYLDLDLKIKDLISIIFYYIFFIREGVPIIINYKRAHENQTTDYIVKNPMIFKTDAEVFSRGTFLLEYKNKNLLDLQNKTGYEIGLKNREEILLKLNKQFYTSLISLPLDGSYLRFNYFGKFNFITYKGESSNECKKRLSFIFTNKINFGSLTSPNPFSKEKITLYDFYYDIILSGNGPIGGGPSIEFSDVSKGKIKELKFNKSAPSWRKVKDGLNIFGICQNDVCKAYNKEVVYIPKAPYYEPRNNIEHEFNLNNNIENIKCPLCLSIIKVKTCGFWKCEYQFKGKKIEKGKLIYYDSNPRETIDDKFEYFDPSDNGKVTWTELIIYAIPRQKIKYKQKNSI